MANTERIGSMRVARPAPPRRQAAALVLADGTVFVGQAMGAFPPGGVASGEVVFNTVMSGYQEVLTDPSYAGQIVAFTYPHIGNYGLTGADDESARPACRGLVVKDITRRPSNWRSVQDLESWMTDHGLPGITGVDTRRLTRHIRHAGAMPAAFGPADIAALRVAAAAEPGTSGVDLVATVTTAEPYMVEPVGGTSGGRPRHIVAYDFGIKSSILAQLARLGRVEVVPAYTPAAEVLARAPDGVFLSNGPGDPEAVTGAAANVAEIVGRVPVFGICLGHQLLALALGGSTTKLAFGHHGGNQPVGRADDGAVEITSQNHNFAVVAGSVPDAVITHTNLNDGVVAGLSREDLSAFGVQYHPEAGPGPHDSRYLFDRFADLMDGVRGATAGDGVPA
ncbi:MAG: glutamine-hydrolyzing carbamoyl-phosphate synthase small subunit [Acidimicrobiales bacterium]